MEMKELEKVIKGIECHRKKIQTTNSILCLECPYSEPKPIGEWCMNGLMDDIYALLKEQEPILLENQHKPYGISTNSNSPWISRCPRCGKKVEGKKTRFCKYCGQEVKWE